MEPALAVLVDLQAAEPIAGLQVVASPLADLNGMTLGVLEPSAVIGDVVQLAAILILTSPPSMAGATGCRGRW